MLKILTYFLFPLAFVSVAQSALTCSANGTQIYYINGIKVTESEFYGFDKNGEVDPNAKTTPKNIQDIISTYKDKIDEKNNVYPLKMVKLF